MNKELIVRKNVAGFIEKVFRYFGTDISHDECKKIIYNEASASTKSEEKLKKYFDGYCYLLNNHKNILTHEFLETFFYILDKNLINDKIIHQMVIEFFYLSELTTLEKAVTYHNKIRKILNEQDEFNRTIISLMMFNYTLVKEGVPSLKLSLLQIKKYFKCMDNDLKLYDFFLQLSKEQKPISKKYFQSLEMVAISDIAKKIIADKDELINEYHVMGVMIHGSFAKREERIDSDIDLIVRLDMDLLYDERKEIIEKLSLKYTKAFQRLVDIQEMSVYLSDEFIKEARKIKIIYMEEK